MYNVAYLSVGFPFIQIEVVNVVTKLVIARIILCSSFTAENACFLFGLDTLCTSGNTTAGNTAVEEANVITSTIENNGSVVETLLLVPVFIENTKFTGASRVGGIGRIVDLEDTIWRCHHIVVHKEADLLVLSSRKVFGIVG